MRRWSFRALSRQLYSIRETGQKEDYKWKQFHGDCVRLSRWTGIVSDNQNMFQMVMNYGFPCSGNQFNISCVFISSYVAIVDASLNWRGKEFYFRFDSFLQFEYVNWRLLLVNNRDLLIPERIGRVKEKRRNSCSEYNNPCDE